MDDDALTWESAAQAEARREVLCLLDGVLGLAEECIEAGGIYGPLLPAPPRLLRRYRWAIHVALGGAAAASNDPHLAPTTCGEVHEACLWMQQRFVHLTRRARARAIRLRLFALSTEQDTVVAGADSSKPLKHFRLTSHNRSEWGRRAAEARWDKARTPRPTPASSGLMEAEPGPPAA